MPKDGYRSFNVNIPEELWDAFDKTKKRVGGFKDLHAAFAVLMYLEDFDARRMDDYSVRLEAWLAGGAPYPITRKAVDKLAADWRAGHLPADDDAGHGAGGA